MKVCSCCGVEINKKSKKWKNQIYCSRGCKKKTYRRRLSQQSRVDRKRSNLRQNEEILYLVKQCRRANTVQNLHGHDIKSFLDTMELVRKKPKGDVRLCHIAPVKGSGFTGLFHCKNLFYGGSYQNLKTGNRYLSGGLSISNKKLKMDWAVSENTSTNAVLLKIERYLGDIIPQYLELAPVRKSKKVQVVNKLLSVDHSLSFDGLMTKSYSELTLKYSKMTGVISYVPIALESKYITYMDGMARFVSYGDSRASNLKSIMRTMAVAYIALNKEKRSKTHNKYFYVDYAHLIPVKYIKAKLKDPSDWSRFKDLIYFTAFYVLQGKCIDPNKFKAEVMSHLQL